MKKNKLILIGLVFIAGFSMGDTNTNSPPSIAPPPPSENIKYVPYYVFPHSSQAVTNDDLTVTIIYSATITNTVEKYAPMIVIKPRSRDSMFDEWEYTGHEFLMKLGTNSSKFYDLDFYVENPK